ncbi:formate-dependent phosphoribosylglycinamide formyltransferase [Alphaproteobacteria bacterium]|nr:formate-dependent phosphoribosylglycinamide formyltransferase [Alphaproteobacteria bacterium]
MKKILLLGSGELGKEFVISAQRLGCKVIACDKYENAPAMQVADSSKVFDMLDKQKLRKTVESIKPDYIVPEIEAIRTEELVSLENDGYVVIPSARAVNLTMNRDSIRDRATQLGIKTAKYKYANNKEQLDLAIKEIGLPCIIKPVMSSSGKGQALINSEKDSNTAWSFATKNMRGDRIKVIIEEVISFKSEITLLTVKQKINKTVFCDPIGHTQENGDYKESWQPANISQALLKKAQKISKIITDDLGGKGIFGVEFFVLEDDIVFSELSPRPHDTGMVTLFTQNLSQFDLHLRAILGLPIPNVKILRNGFTSVIKTKSNEENAFEYSFEGLENALKFDNIDIRLFGKPLAWNGRRLGVILSPDKKSAEAAKQHIKIIKKIVR